jgi:DNA relaxase NicK
MQTKVDFIAFTVVVRELYEPGDLDAAIRVHQHIDDFLGGLWMPITIGHTWEWYKDKGFYHTRIFDVEAKISVHFGNVNTNIYVEFGGQALDYVRRVGLYEKFIEKVAPRTSRVDFAVDFETQCGVKDFIVNRQKGRFKAGGNIWSEDGETSYVGSWKAERFARVYRYHKPHPRSNLLRAEVVLRGSYAKQAMTIILAEGEVKAAMAAHAPFGWTHELWQPTEATESRIVSKRSDKESASTLRWLNGDVAAVIVRLHRNGLLNAQEWFDTYILPETAK